jgi:hypothetical protein
LPAVPRALRAHHRQDTLTDGDDVILFFKSWDNAGNGFPDC